MYSTMISDNKAAIKTWHLLWDEILIVPNTRRNGNYIIESLGNATTAIILQYKCIASMCCTPSIYTKLYVNYNSVF